MNTIGIKAPADFVLTFLLDPYRVLRLNPSWHVREIKAVDTGTYVMTLYDDRSDETSQITLKIELHEQSIHYRMNSDTIEFIADEASPLLTVLSIKGNSFRSEDLPYWLRGLKNYIQLEAKQGGIAKWFLDRFWLKMTPSQRRIAIIIILAEGIGIAALIAVAVALRLMR
jgi:hypothetical protein